MSERPRTRRQPRAPLARAVGLGALVQLVQLVRLVQLVQLVRLVQPGGLAGLALLTGCAGLPGCVRMGLGARLAELPASPASLYVPPRHRTERLPVPDEAPLSPAPLDLAQCLAIARERNPDTRASWQRTHAAAAGVGQAFSAYLPTADLTAGASQSDAVLAGRRPQPGSVSSVDVGVGLGYTLFDGGARAAGLAGAEAELAAAGFQHNATLQDVALRVEEAYYQLLAARELERVAEQAVRQTRVHQAVARVRHRSGVAARSDVLKADTEKADADLQLVRARSQVRTVRGQLASAMGLRPSRPLQIAELPPASRPRERLEIEALLREAAARRPELQAALAQAEVERAKVDAATARYWPKVTLRSEIDWQTQTSTRDRSAWSLGAALALPLFDGLQRESTIRRAESDLAGARAAIDQRLRGIELEVWTAHSRWVEAEEAIGAAQALVASAEENARVTEGEYRNGTASIIEVTDAQTARTTARVRLVQARLQRYTALAQLGRAVGRRRF